eukprot:6240083-Heterocapsa_arctica.AAC.1
MGKWSALAEILQVPAAQNILLFSKMLFSKMLPAALQQEQDASPCGSDALFSKMLPAVQKRLRNRHNEGDVGKGCPKCRWLASRKGGCSECVLAKAGDA